MKLITPPLIADTGKNLEHAGERRICTLREVTEHTGIWVFCIFMYPLQHLRVCMDRKSIWFGAWRFILIRPLLHLQV